MSMAARNLIDTGNNIRFVWSTDWKLVQWKKGNKITDHPAYALILTSVFIHYFVHSMANEDPYIY